ncbi:retrovirus-related pol polyprotein from transposon TNT 1-94 [Tanacetum coccineum]
MAMQEELNQFETNNVWSLVPPPDNQTIIGTKWVFKNKLDENGIVSRNKPRLVAQGYNQQEGIDFDETYALVARLESIRILLAYACAHDFKITKHDVVDEDDKTQVLLWWIFIYDLVVNDVGKISKLPQMDDHVESCLQQIKVRSIMIKG